MVKIEAQITPSWLRAVERAAADRKAGRTAVRVAPKTYQVASASGGAAHTVVVDSLVQLRATCDCTAGQRGLPCRHAAAALCEATRHIAQCERERAATTSLPSPAGVDVYDGRGLAEGRTPAPSPERAAEVDRLMSRFSRM